MSSTRKQRIAHASPRSYFNQLNDDCFLELLKYLTLADKAILARTYPDNPMLASFKLIFQRLAQNSFRNIEYKSAVEILPYFQEANLKNYYVYTKDGPGVNALGPNSNLKKLTLTDADSFPVMLPKSLTEFYFTNLKNYNPIRVKIRRSKKQLRVFHTLRFHPAKDLQEFLLSTKETLEDLAICVRAGLSECGNLIKVLQSFPKLRSFTIHTGTKQAPFYSKEDMIRCIKTLYGLSKFRVYGGRAFDGAGFEPSVGPNYSNCWNTCKMLSTYRGNISDIEHELQSLNRNARVELTGDSDFIVHLTPMKLKRPAVAAETAGSAPKKAKK